MKSALVGRLLTQHGFTEHPEHADVPIERPIFVVGLPRTGTTALHRLLNADPRHQGLELWLTEYPQPRPPRETWDDDPIFAAMQAAFSEHHIENPEFMGIHYMDADIGRGVLAAAAADRQVDRLRVARQRAALLRLAGASRTGPTPTSGTGQPAADRPQRPREAVGAEEPVPPGRARRADDRLPRRAGRAAPTATRSTSIASACSLSAEATAGTSTTFVGETIGRTQLEMLSRSWRTFTRARAAYDPAQFVDVDYREFVADPVAHHPRASTTPSASSGRRTRRRPSTEIDRESRSGRQAAVPLVLLADYGLTEDEVRAAFA